MNPTVTADDVYELLTLGRSAYVSKYSAKVSLREARDLWTTRTIKALEAEGHKISYANYLRMGDLLASCPATFMTLSAIAVETNVPKENLVSAVQQLGGFVSKNAVGITPHQARTRLGYNATEYMFTPEQAREWLAARPA